MGRHVHRIRLAHTAVAADRVLLRTRGHGLGLACAIYPGVAWSGVGPPLLIDICILVVGVFVISWRIHDGRNWREEPRAADPVLAAGGSHPVVDDAGVEPMTIVLGYDNS